MDARVRTGRWTQVWRGIYALPGSPPSARRALMMACLRAGEGAAISHSTAAWIIGFDGFRDDRIEISTSRGIQCSGLVVHRVKSLPRWDVQVIDGIRLTTPTRTLIDLAGAVTSERLELCLEEALRRRLTSITYVRRRLNALRASGRPGIKALAKLLDERAPDTATTASRAQIRLRRLIRDSDLPPPQEEYVIYDGDRFIARVDFGYPSLKLAIEAESWEYHQGKAPWKRDLQRRNELAELGWEVTHVTWEDLTERPLETLDRIRAARRRRGFY